MANVLDVAAYILQQRGGMATMKLQKLVYYSQAWHLAWEGEPLFDSKIQAWANGPVVPLLYQRHRLMFTVDEEWGKDIGDPTKLKGNERESVDVVLAEYGGLDPWQLSELTHGEDPWIRARGSLAPGARGESVIPQADMQAYYEGLIRAAD